MGSFLSVVAVPAVQQVTEKRLIGKPYVRIGRLFVVIGAWLYQQGGALGYGLKEHPGLLGKMLGVVPDLATESMDGLREFTALHLAEVEGKEKNFYQLYTVRELQVLGIDVTQWPPSKDLEKKASPEMVSDVMRISFHKGAGFGYHFSETFMGYWENYYRPRRDNEWQEARAAGLVLSETQQPRPLDETVAELAAAAIEWAAEEAPDLLDVHEIDVLKKLVVSSLDGTLQSI